MRSLYDFRLPTGQPLGEAKPWQVKEAVAHYGSPMNARERFLAFVRDGSAA